MLTASTWGSSSRAGVRLSSHGRTSNRTLRMVGGVGTGSVWAGRPDHRAAGASHQSVDRSATGPVVGSVAECHDQIVDAGDSWKVLSRRQRPIDAAAVIGLF